MRPCAPWRRRGAFPAVQLARWRAGYAVLLLFDYYRPREDFLEDRTTMADVSETLVAEAVSYLDEILEEHAVRFAHLDRGELVERIERMREAAVAARLVLTERRTLSGR